MKTFTAVAKIKSARYFCDMIVQVHVHMNVIVFGKNSLLQIELSCYSFNIICFSLSLARQFIPSLRQRVNRWMISEWLSMWVLVRVRKYSQKFLPTSKSPPTPTATNDRVFYHCLHVCIVQIFYHPLLRLNLVSEEEHCKIFGNIHTILSLHEGTCNTCMCKLVKSYITCKISSKKLLPMVREQFICQAYAWALLLGSKVVRHCLVSFYVI